LRSLRRPSDTGGQHLVQAAPIVAVRDIFRRFWPDARPSWRWMWLMFVMVALSPLLDAAGIWMFKVLIDDVLTPRDLAAFGPVALAYIGITLAQGLLAFATAYLAAWIGEHFLLRLRTRVFTHLHTLSLSFFERRPLGDLLSRLTGDIAAVEALVLAGVARFISSVITIGGFTGVIFYLNWQLALIALVAVPAFWFISRRFSRRIKAASREARRRAAGISIVAEESLGNAMLVQAYGREDAEVGRFAEQSRGSVDAQLAAARIGRPSARWSTWSRYSGSWRSSEPASGSSPRAGSHSGGCSPSWCTSRSSTRRSEASGGSPTRSSRRPLVPSASSNCSTSSPRSPHPTGPSRYRSPVHVLVSASGSRRTCGSRT